MVKVDCTFQMVKYLKDTSKMIKLKDQVLSTQYKDKQYEVVGQITGKQDDFNINIDCAYDKYNMIMKYDMMKVIMQWQNS